MEARPELAFPGLPKGNARHGASHPKEAESGGAGMIPRIAHALTVGYCERTAIDDAIVIGLGLAVGLLVVVACAFVYGFVREWRSWMNE